MKLFFIALVTLAPFILLHSYSSRGAEPVILKKGGTELRIYPETLSIDASDSASNRKWALSSSTKRISITSLKIEAAHVSWKIPERMLDVSVDWSNKNVTVQFETQKDQILIWPELELTGDSIILWPDNEGLLVPANDPFWHKAFAEEDCRNVHGGISMPFWGVSKTNGSGATIFTTDIETDACIKASTSGISLHANHQFRARDKNPIYGVEFTLNEPSLSAPALAYRDYLHSTGKFATLAQKIAAVPEATKLLGAIHAYLWGTGKTNAAITALKQLGVKRALLLYDPSVNGKYTPLPDLNSFAKDQGYLIGFYDSLLNIQNPVKSNMQGSVFDHDLYINGGIQDEKGTRKHGFGGLGYELSSEALKRATSPFLKDRVTKYKSSGTNALFIDSDAYGDLYDDYDPKHLMTPEMDRQNRLERLRLSGLTSGLVLGSESAAGWSTPVLFYSHGTETPQTHYFWDLYRQKKLFGGWWPDERPPHFFKTVTPPEEFVHAEFDPLFRIPMYQLVYHDSIVSTDRWEGTIAKFKGLEKTRTLLNLLYGVPTLWNLDVKEIKTQSKRIRDFAQTISPLIEKIAVLPMTKFEYLTRDRTLQRSQFSDEATVTANFGATEQSGVKPMCAMIQWIKAQKTQAYCPL